MTKKDTVIEKDIEEIVSDQKKQKITLAVIRTVTPAVLGFSIGCGIKGIIDEKPYAITQTVVSAVAGSFYYRWRYEAEHKKTGRKLNKLFSDKTMHLGRGSIILNRVKKDLAGTEEQLSYGFDMADWQETLNLVIKQTWSNILNAALYYNMEKGQGIKDSFLNAVHMVVDITKKDVFSSQKAVIQAIEKSDLTSIFVLKMCQNIYDCVNSCLSDEQVLDFLKKGITNNTSLFKSRPNQEKLGKFLNREPYVAGKKLPLLLLDMGKYASLAAVMGVSFTGNLVSKEGAVFVGAGLASSLAHLRIRNQHLRRQRQRYALYGGDFAKTRLLERYENENKMTVWIEEEERLTRYGSCKSVRDTYRDVISFLEKMPRQSCKMAATYVYSAFVLGDKKIKQVLDDLQKGMTLEQVARKTDLNSFHRAMEIDFLMGALKAGGSRGVYSFVFHLNSGTENYQQLLAKEKEDYAKKIAPKIAYYERLFARGVISEDEKNNYIKDGYEKIVRQKGIVVTSLCKLPRPVLKLKQTKIQNEKE